MNWRDIPGFNKKYQVSSLGLVKTKSHFDSVKRLKKEKIRNPSMDTHGYLQVKMEGRMYFVHHLVLLAFVGPRPKGYVACHKNGNRTDNRANNLKWDTSSSNQQDMKLHGTFRGIPIIRSDGKKYCSLRETRKDGFSDKLVARVCKGLCEQHKGYGWSYAD